MKIVSWNLGHQTREAQIPAALVTSVEALAPDMLVLNEFVDGTSRGPLIAALDHLDASIRLFDPEIDFADMPVKMLPPPNAAFRGELPVKLDTKVTQRDIENRHLICFGDASSNSVLKQALPQLPQNQLTFAHERAFRDLHLEARGAEALSG